MRVLLDLIDDNLRVASAVEAKLEAIVTRDPEGFAGSLPPSLLRPNSWQSPRKYPMPEPDQPRLIEVAFRK